MVDNTGSMRSNQDVDGTADFTGTYDFDRWLVFVDTHRQADILNGIKDCFADPVTERREQRNGDSRLFYCEAKKMKI